MTKRKITAFLTAFVLLSSMSVLPVSAGIIEWGDGGIICEDVFGLDLMIETDGTILTEDMVSDVENFSQLLTYEQYAMGFGSSFTIVDYTPVNTDHTYVLSLSNSDSDELNMVGREIMINLDCIENVHLTQKTVYSPAELDDHLYLRTKNAGVVIDSTAFPELDGMEINQSSDPEYNTKWRIYYMDDKEYAALDLTQCTEYEKYLRLEAFCNMMMEKYSDVLDLLAPTFFSEEETGVIEGAFTASSVWTSAGDSNSDGTVDSTDAAEMLVAAAQIGTGADVAVTSAADVNADGELNAEDAAAVLTYAAVKGTGAEPSWVDILRK